MNTLIPGAPLRSLSPTTNEYQRAQGESRAAKPARVARFTLDAPEHSGTIPGARGDILTPGVALTSNLAVIFTLNQHTSSVGGGGQCIRQGSGLRSHRSAQSWTKDARGDSAATKRDAQSEFEHRHAGARSPYSCNRKTRPT